MAPRSRGAPSTKFRLQAGDREPIRRRVQALALRFHASGIRRHHVAVPSSPDRGPIQRGTHRGPIETFEEWAERAYPKLIYYHMVEKGGHFAAWEQPTLFTSEMRAAFETLRKDVALGAGK